jgi:hypothetical protein
MSNEDQLRVKLRKIEALYAGATTAGEKSAADAAAQRIRAKFETASKQESAQEFKFSIADPWSRQLFTALCRRYGIKPYRYARMRRQTVMVRAPASFMEKTLWPQFQDLSSALDAHLYDITSKIIAEEVHGAPEEAEEIAEPQQLGSR